MQARTVTRAALLALLGSLICSMPSRGEFWPTEYFLQQEPKMQIAYITGLFDMYEYARDELAPDPDDWLWPCLRGVNPEELRQMFVDFLLNDPASWRI
mgnify:CR=1 FL=1